MPDRPLKRPRLMRPLFTGSQKGEADTHTGDAAANASGAVHELRPTIDETAAAGTGSETPSMAGTPSGSTETARQAPASPDGRDPSRDDTRDDDDLFERPIVPSAALDRDGPARTQKPGKAHPPHGETRKDNRADKAQDASSAAAATRTRAKPARPPRRASSPALYLATIGSAFWSGIMAAYAVGYYGPAGLLTLSPITVALLAAALFGPLAIIWGFALVIYWGSQMRMSAEHMAEATRALLAPNDAAIAASASVGHAVSAEMRRMEQALKQAEARAADLRKSLNGELNGLEAASARAEMRARTLRDLVGSERKALADTAQALEQESAQVVEATRAQVELVSGVTGRAAEQMTEAQAGIGRASEYLSKTMEAVARSTKAVRENVEAQADRLDATAETAVTRAGELAGQFATQGEALTETSRTLAAENERAVRIFAEQRETLEALANDLRDRAGKIEQAIAGHADLISEALDQADAKAMGLGPRIAREAERLSAAARVAASEIEKTTGLMETRTSDMQARMTDATGHLQQTIDFSTRNVDASGERLQALLSDIGTAAQTAARDMTAATEDLGTRLSRLPEDAGVQAERLRTIMAEQIGAISTVAESVADALERMGGSPVSGAWPPADTRAVAGASQAPQADTPSDTAPAPAMAPAATPAPASERGSWRLGDVLSAARAREDRAQSMPRAAHHIVETLQSLSIDIDRALEDQPPVELWKRYRAGERGVFARRLAGLKGKEPYTRIAERYQSNAEFREDADRYMDQFETLLTDANDKNPDGLLGETYLSSDIGKVYALLAEATGRVS